MADNVNEIKPSGSPSNVEVDQKDLDAAMGEYQKLDELAESRASKLSEELVKQILETRDADKYNMTLAVLTVTKTLTHLASYFYEDEKTFLEDVRKARQSIPSDIVPALLFARHSQSVFFPAAFPIP